MGMKSKILPLVFLSLFLSSGVYSNETLTEKYIDSDAQEYMLDEVIVTGDSALLSLKKEVFRAEDFKFEIFNSLNSTDDFDITCKDKPRSGPGMKRRVCDVGYMKKERWKDITAFMFMGIPPRSDAQLAIENAHKTKALNKEMMALSIEHPELATAMVRHQELQQLFLQERIERYKDSWLRYLAGNPAPIENKDIMNEIDIWEKVFIDHRRGMLKDDIWARWDNWCKTKLQKKYYQNKWEAANQEKYADDFKTYVNTIISGN